jgi:pilus assembly protein CpaE
LTFADAARGRNPCPVNLKQIAGQFIKMAVVVYYQHVCFTAGGPPARRVAGCECMASVMQPYRDQLREYEKISHTLIPAGDKFLSIAVAENSVNLITVSSDANFHREISQVLEAHFRFDSGCPMGYHDAALLQGAPTGEKYIIIIDFAEHRAALALARAVDERPEFACIAIGGGSNREELLELMQAGVREVLLPQSTPEEIREATRRAFQKLASAEEVLGDIYAFVPAKPGSGATTIATHATAMASRLTTEPVLLLDFDIRLGVTSFLLKAEGNHTVVDALKQTGRLDHDLWSGLVSQCGNLHLLGSGPVDFSQRVPPERFAEVLQFALQKYSMVAVDLPGAMEEHETETLLRAKRIFLVCTPDIGALHVARRKSKWFHDLGLDANVSVVLNCVERRNALGVADIERIIQMPIRYLIPAGSAEISRAAQKGVAIEGSSPLAKQIGKIASEMAAARALPKKPHPMRRFVEYFSVSAARDVRT